MVIEILSIVAPVFICAAIGYGWARAGRPFDSVFVGMLVADIATPCLIFATLTRLRPDIAALAEMAGATLACLAGFALVGTAALKLFKMPLRVFLPSIVLPNVGNAGVPISLFAFGDRGLGLAIVFFAVSSIAQYTGGVAIAMGRLSVRELLRVPLVYAAGLSVLIILTEAPVPRVVANTTGLIGNAAIPLMLMALGVALSKLRFAGLSRSAVAGVLRLGIGFSVALAVAEVMDLDPVTRAVLVIQGAMPVAVINYLIALRYDNSPSEVAGAVLVSSLLSVVTAPLVLALLL